MGKSFVERFTVTMLLPVAIAIWISWILPIVPPEMLEKHGKAEIFSKLPELVERFALIVASVGVILGMFQTPVSISKFDPRLASKPELKFRYL
mgnify:CR=1 FL=1